MEKTWKPTVAGILDIVAGALSFIVLMLLVIGIVVFMAMGGTDLPVHIPANLISVIVVALAIPVLLLDILAIVGGSYALRRRIWGLALAGSIAALFGSWPLGIAAIVLTVMSKNEFK